MKYSFFDLDIDPADVALRKFLGATAELNTDEQKTAFDNYFKEHQFDKDQKERFLRLRDRFMKAASLKIEGYIPYDMGVYFNKFFYDFCFYLEILNDKELETSIEVEINNLQKECEGIELDLKYNEKDEAAEFNPFSARETDKTFYIETSWYRKYLINLLAHLRSEAIEQKSDLKGKTESKKPVEKASEIPVRYYVYYHLLKEFFEFKDGKKQRIETIAMGKEEIEKVAKEYPVKKTITFYNRYNDFKNSNQRIVDLIRNMKPKERKILNKIIKSFGKDDFFAWYNRTFLDEYKIT